MTKRVSIRLARTYKGRPCSFENFLETAANGLSGVRPWFVKASNKHRVQSGVGQPENRRNIAWWGASPMPKGAIWVVSHLRVQMRILGLCVLLLGIRIGAHSEV